MLVATVCYPTICEWLLDIPNIEWKNPNPMGPPEFIPRSPGAKMSMLHLTIVITYCLLELKELVPMFGY